MTIIARVLPYAQIILSVILIVAITLQQTGTDAGGAFGGGSSGALYHTRRGFEKFLFTFSIITAILFAASAIIAIFVK